VIAAIAAKQHGNITRAQMLAAGLGDDTVDSWLRRGRLYQLHRGVYALGHLALPPLGAQMAAVLACGEAALLSHSSAAHVWGLRPRPMDGIVEVTVMGTHVRGRRGIKVHRTAALDPLDARLHQNIPITAPGRALLEIAPELTTRELERALDEAFVRKLTTRSEVAAVLARYPRQRGSAILQELIDARRSTARTNSGGEEAFLRLIREAGLPRPRVNAKIGRWVADFYWPEQGVVVEIDGHDFHSSRTALERDHRKDLDLQDAGLRVLRFSGRQVSREPLVAMVRVAQSLERAQPALSPRTRSARAGS
jgi:very-short-patch-repair endonuclease